MVHEHPAAVLLLDAVTGDVVYVNDRARQLAPHAQLPLHVQQWSRLARLEVAPHQAPAAGTGARTLEQVAAGDPTTGQQIGTLLRLTTDPDNQPDQPGAGLDTEPDTKPDTEPDTGQTLWAIGTPLHAAPASLHARSMLVLMPVHLPQLSSRSGVEPDSDTGTGADTRGRGGAVALPSPGSVLATSSVLAGSLAMAISQPTGPNREDNPLLWVSPSFEHVTGYTAAQAVGRDCRFLQGPDTDPTTVAHLREAIRAERTVSVTLLNYRHDGSAFHNHLIVSPVFDATGRLSHHVSVQSDVTQQVLTARERDRARAAEEQARTAEGQARSAEEQARAAEKRARMAGEQARAAGERARTAQAGAEASERFGRVLLALSEALAAAVTVDDVARTVTDVVAAELGAAGGGLMLADPARTRLDYVSMAAMPPGIDASWSRIDWEEDAPPAVAVRTRQAIFHRDSAAMSSAHPNIHTHAAVPQMGATVNLPLIAADEVIGAVFLWWTQAQELPPAQRAALEALARYAAQAVQRASLLAQRRSAAQVLQQSLLTRLPEPDHLELRARYVPAAVGEHVGGDWYDAIVLHEGSTTVVIGDVTGHDLAAAARMGQLRGLLRAHAVDRAEAPSAIVARLERSMAALGMDGLATLVLACIEQTDDDRQAGLRRLRWTNAGHPPPILLHPDGHTQLLESTPELLVGLLPDTSRSDQVTALPPGSTVLLYTDGLIEHRGRSLTDGITDLRRVLSTHAGKTLQELLDHLVTELIGQAPDDDCAILAVRAHPEDRPRPPEAGPNHLPQPTRTTRLT
ncbi:PAS domain S-box-containing protein [Kineococcus radiotolerans]|uniref:PAS domain S-box-containing protein n=1 Tax=Kineococcus radiotolerans TaxID=131568 RepID=A0A7W4TQE6_KINRA|nr:SpoIIE family protein phosphatase [Kineococcus radiotolerans]MBB2903188.1 PAS domain S-box-containing protein [Kineococcus radiotolerans]